MPSSEEAGVINLDGTGFNTGECYCPKVSKKEIQEVVGQKIHMPCLGVVNG